ncbi:EXLDI protein [Humibacter antri]
MATRNIYVSADDGSLFDRAAELAGGLSAAVAAGLRLYVAQREREEGQTQMQEIEVEVQDGPVVTVKRFTGRRILRYEDHDGVRSKTYRVYATERGQFAVHVRDDPDWRALSSPNGDDSAWNDPRTWNRDWWQTGGRTLTVYSDSDAMRGSLPDELVAAVTAALAGPHVEELDI